MTCIVSSVLLYVLGGVLAWALSSELTTVKRIVCAIAWPSLAVWLIFDRD